MPTFIFSSYNNSSLSSYPHTSKPCSSISPLESPPPMATTMKPLTQSFPISNLTSITKPKTLTSILSITKPKTLTSILSIPTRPTKSFAILTLSKPQISNLFFTQNKPFSSITLSHVVSSAQGDQGELANAVFQDIGEGEGEGAEVNWGGGGSLGEPESGLSDWEGGGDGAVESGGVEEEEEGERYVQPLEEAKLFVGNLSYDVDSERLAKVFQSAGVVEMAEVVYNRQTDQSRGFGFVTMSTVEEAEKAVEMFHRYELNGRLLAVNKAAPRGVRVERLPRTNAPAFRIYVGNLSWDLDSEGLKQVFLEHGTVVDARVVYDRETGRSRGFGFVTMASEAEMNAAIAAVDGQSVDGRTLRAKVAEERPRRLF